MSKPFDLLVTGGRVFVCDVSGGASAAEQPTPIEGGFVAMAAGEIVEVGPARPGLDARVVIDAQGCAVLPGLVDCHTHLIFAGSRVAEFARRMAGEDYRAIAEEGGGIAATVRATREASDEALFASAARRARAMRALGTTTVEIKSGYGLTTKDELRLLRVGRRLHAEGVVRTTTTFLGAHALPAEAKRDRKGYVQRVIDEMLPTVVSEDLADACDVYIDEGAFTLEEGRAVLTAAKDAGLAVRGHVGQFRDLGGAELLAELGALSADHLEQLSMAGAMALAKADVTAVLLPGAWRTLRQAPPNLAQLREAGVRMAVGTDCNPGTSPCTDLGLCAALAVRDAGLTLEEAVLAVTAHAARAAGVPRAGTLAEGHHADLVICGTSDPRTLGYGLGNLRPRLVVLGGEVVHEALPGSLPLW